MYIRLYCRGIYFGYRDLHHDIYLLKAVPEGLRVCQLIKMLQRYLKAEVEKISMLLCYGESSYSNTSIEMDRLLRLSPV